MADKSQSRMGRRNQKKVSKVKKKPAWKKILLGFFMLVVAMLIIGGSMVTYFIATAPDIDASKLSDPFPSQVYDKNKELVATLGNEKRTKVEYSDLPQVLIDAVTATEDSRFFQHHGIDVRRIAGAVKANITNGFGSEGASTITQQVVERAFLSPDKKLKLKVQEQWLALKLEREYSKQEILEMYLNKIYYGSGAYGVGKAAEVYFGKKDLHDLTLTEAAILAGLPQRPTAYDPFQHPDLTKERVKTVLKLMVRHNKITQAQADKALKVDIPSLLTKKKQETKTPYQAFLQEVRKEIDEQLDGANMYTDGLKIYTTLDTHAQDYVDNIMTDGPNNPIPYPDKKMQAGMAVIDTKTGAIRAIGGNRNTKNVDGWNNAIMGGQQPGSTAKPIIAYGPAIEYNKWSTYHQVNDDKAFKVGASEIRNWNRGYSGWMSIRKGLADSLNVPAVKALDETGFDKAQKFAENLGIKFANDQISIRDAIGGTATNMTPLQVAGAYSAFGNEGIYNKPHAVTKVEYPDGKTVDLKPEPKAAMSDYTAYMVTDMLKTAVQEGTGKNANIPSLPVAGKTGTTNLQDREGSPDAWFSGYTTNYTITAWAGGYTDANGKKDVIPGSNNTQIPLYMFKHTMEELSKDKQTADFTKPDSVVELPVVKGSNPAVIASGSSSNTVNELFVKGNLPSKKAQQKEDSFPPVSNLTADYDKDDKQIDVQWDHDSDEDASFIVSASIDGGGMQTLGTTSDDSFQINGVKEGATYTIQVVAVSKKDASLKSEPKSVNVKTGDKEEELKAVTNLQASYSDGSQTIEVSWDYDGSATFEVNVDGQKQSTSSNGITISGAQPGKTYTITVTPVDSSGNRGGAASTQVTIPGQTESEDPNQQDDQNQDQDQDQSDNSGQQDDGDQEQNDNTPQQQPNNNQGHNNGNNNQQQQQNNGNNGNNGNRPNKNPDQSDRND